MRISEEKLNWENPVDGYEYKILHTDGEREGDAQLIYKQVDDLPPDLQSVLLNQRLALNDKVAQLNKFYPNGSGLNEEKRENMGRGVGTRVLQHLEIQAINKGAKAIFVYTLKKSAQNFFQKSG